MSEQSSPVKKRLTNIVSKQHISQKRKDSASAAQIATKRHRQDLPEDEALDLPTTFAYTGLAALAAEEQEAIELEQETRNFEHRRLFDAQMEEYMMNQKRMFILAKSEVIRCIDMIKNASKYEGKKKLQKSIRC